MFDLLIKNGQIVDGTGSPAYEGDIALSDGRIAEIGRLTGRAKRTIDADGCHVTPGFVDAHTHLDGQVSWDEELAPSPWHGVTTAIMGNCGVGFAPVRPESRDFLVNMMESVEEIPGSALAEGISWDWESFPEYLDALERMPRTIDIAAQVPHCALRSYVMGEARSLAEELATEDDIAAMRRLTAEALRAGALGFSTSRTLLHRMKGGQPVPGSYSDPGELVGISLALKEAGHGVFQMISDHLGREPDFTWMREIARVSGRPLVFSMVQTANAPEEYLEVLASLQRAWDEEGLDIRASVGWRPPGILMGLQTTINPFSGHPAYRPLLERSSEECLGALLQAPLRERLLQEETKIANPFLRQVFSDWDNMYILGDPPDYEPEPSSSIGARARSVGRPPAKMALEAMLLRDGREYLYYPLQNYAHGNLDAARNMLVHPRSTASLSDAGAHVGTICDASYTSFMISHWTRDRSRGAKLDLPFVIRKQTRDTAELYGLYDRGTLEVGKWADVNIIDTEHLHLHAPHLAVDLPSNSGRLLQRVDGFRSTLVAGKVIVENGQFTGERPGRLVRGPKASTQSQHAA